MINRFLGKDGKKLFFSAVCSQKIVNNEHSIAKDILKISKMRSIKCGEKIITQGADDNQIYLILSGVFSIIINGREVASRQAGNHVGEMALIDPSARRSATVIAIEDSVVAEIPENKFSLLARKYPQLWRRLANELAERLRQRSRFLKMPNNIPIIFIGSSKENIAIAKGIKAGLPKSVICLVWTDGIFKPSKTSIESLIDAVQKSDFAVLILEAEDMVVSRSNKKFGPRDNCIFELGLFMGALGRERVFMVRPKRNDLKIPSDLLGVTPIYYDSKSKKSIRKRLVPACAELANEFLKGPK